MDGDALGGGVGERVDRSRGGLLEFLGNICLL